jgi:protein-S-isoprenylcysteine O-methyltransferase Ste14
MGDIYLRAGLALWGLWLVSWWAAALWRSKMAAEAPRSSWRWYIALVALGVWMLFAIRVDRSMHLWNVGPALGWAMVAVIAASLAFAWWARLTMGRMWSGGVMRTAEHRVIETGPFAWVRHPIYTALIFAGLAFAAIRATPMAFGGAALMSLGFYLKARVEERFLTQELTGYPEYRARVPMLLPLPRG